MKQTTNIGLKRILKKFPLKSQLDILTTLLREKVNG